jgi:hypothetical protein
MFDASKYGWIQTNTGWRGDIWIGSCEVGVMKIFFLNFHNDLNLQTLWFNPSNKSNISCLCDFIKHIDLELLWIHMFRLWLVGFWVTWHSALAVRIWLWSRSTRSWHLYDADGGGSSQGNWVFVDSNVHYLGNWIKLECLSSY